ncbi:MAG: hypothetical protein Q4A15_08060 [Prevotellaceae bacterium]|nr:hypothetical protein [Prevotellaceae bacterium]
MGKKVIKVELSQQSIQNAIREVARYKKELIQKCELFAKKLSEDGVEIAKMQIVNLDAIFTSELIDSLHSKKGNPVQYGAIFCVAVGTDHCAFVEFGTGPRGEQKPYKYDLPQGVTWNVNTGKTIHQISDGRYGWFYPGDDGNWYFTEGMPSRPFMHNTSVELYGLVNKVAKEVFK